MAERVWRLRLADSTDESEKFVFSLKDQGWGVTGLAEDEELAQRRTSKSCDANQVETQFSANI